MCKDKRRILGIDFAIEESDKTIVLVIPDVDTINVSEEMSEIRRRIAKALRVPIDLIQPELIRIRDHPAFNSGAIMKILAAKPTPKE